MSDQDSSWASKEGSARDAASAFLAQTVSWPAYPTEENVLDWLRDAQGGNVDYRPGPPVDYPTFFRDSILEFIDISRVNLRDAIREMQEAGVRPIPVDIGEVEESLLEQTYSPEEIRDGQLLTEWTSDLQFFEDMHVFFPEFVYTVERVRDTNRVEQNDRSYFEGVKDMLSALVDEIHDVINIRPTGEDFDSIMQEATSPDEVGQEEHTPPSDEMLDKLGEYDLSPEKIVRQYHDEMIRVFDEWAIQIEKTVIPQVEALAAGLGIDPDAPPLPSRPS
jgi:hypothetical protein